ncbi:MAG: SIMPL domain-containing protein [Dysgonamonadaceae bacterium]|jgi:uncharacterized protein YggE|nr:SIMPL domain-containing protein [Dysgonamonadaceae bacterium]
MKTLMIVLLSGLFVSSFAQTGGKNFIDQNYIEVTGKAELEIVPDLIYLKISLSDKENKDKLPLAAMEQKMTDKLAEIGVDLDKDFSLVDFSSNLQSYWLKANAVQLTKQYQLIVHDSKTLQKVFFEFQQMGISGVSIEKLDHTHIEQYRKDAKVMAVKAAKEKAKLLAEAVGQSIGAALYIQEADSQIPRLSSNVALRGVSSNAKIIGYGVAAEPSDIEFEKIKIESAILVRFQLY